MTTIHIPLQANPLDLNQDGRVTLDELVTSAFWIVKWIMLGMNALNVAALGTFYILSPWEEWSGALRWLIVVLFASMGIGMLVGACVGISRMRRYERAEAEARIDLKHERRRKQFELDQIMGIITRKEESDGNAAVLQEHYARRYLSLSYERGKIITRDDWKRLGLPEDWWNTINEKMKTLGIRDGRRNILLHDDFAAAWGAWCDAITKSRRWERMGDTFVKG